MTTIRDALSQFLAETGEGNRRSMSSPFMVIDLFSKCIDEYGHEDLNEFERVEVGGRPLQATGVHERVWELLTTMTNKVFTSTSPRKLADLMKLGQLTASGEKPRLGISTSEIQDAFFGFLGFTRLDKAEAIRKAIARGVGESTFGYVSGSVPSLGADDKFEVSLDRLVYGRTIGDDEIDLENGFVIAPSAIPTPEPVEPSGEGGDGGSTDTATPDDESATTTTTTPEKATTPARTSVRLTFSATRDQIFGAFPAIVNLADKADGGKVTVEIKADAGDGFDESWLRNAVYEPLDEADIERTE